jgi:ABC-type bacteriocin/lantibiotic exporter with double-glycine peptidase domain
MSRPTTSTLPSPTQAAPAWRLSSLRLVQLLAVGNGVEFDRSQVSLALREQFSAPLDGNSQRLRCLQQVLAASGLQARIRELTLADALDACRHGVQLVAVADDQDDGESWLLIRSTGLSKVRLASEHGADAWLPTAQLAALLGLPGTEAKTSWLLAEPLLPCAAASGHGADDEHSPAGHSDGHHAGPSPLRRLVAILHPEASDIWVVGVFSAIVSLLALATPITVEALVNTVAFGSLLQPVIVLSLVLLAFLSFAAAIRTLQTYIGEIIQRRLFVRVVADLSQRLPRVRQDAYEGAHGPELLNRFFDVMTVQKSAALLVLDGIAIALQTIAGMAVLAFYHPLLLGFDLALLAALAFVVFVLGRGGVITSIEESRAKYGVAAWLEQLALCPLTFKNDGGPERACEWADKLAIDYLRARQRHFAVLMRQIVFTLGLQALAGSVLLGVGGWLVIQGQLTLGQLVAAELIVTLLVGSFAKLGKHLEAYYDLLAAVEKLGHLFDLPVEEQRGEALPAASTGLALRIGAEAIEPGELVALAGPPRSGKSRLLAAVFGLAREAADDILVAGVPVQACDVGALRSQVALVRHCELFTGTLTENLLLDRPHATRAAARACLEELGLGEELRQLPRGLETVLQPHGTPLTGGQARCVVLARALLGKPRLLLIDELLDGLPDSLLPKVMSALARRAGETTIVVATGRQEVAARCQRIIALPAASAHGEPAGAIPSVHATTHS